MASWGWALGRTVYNRVGVWPSASFPAPALLALGLEGLAFGLARIGLMIDCWGPLSNLYCGPFHSSPDPTKLSIPSPHQWIDQAQPTTIERRAIDQSVDQPPIVSLGDREKGNRFNVSESGVGGGPPAQIELVGMLRID